MQILSQEAAAMHQMQADAAARCLLTREKKGGDLRRRQQHLLELCRCVERQDADTFLSGRRTGARPTVVRAAVARRGDADNRSVLRRTHARDAPTQRRGTRLTIACLGWGSLIWKPGALPIRLPWSPDGPEAPIEFTRESAGERITLVIDGHPDVARLRVLWVEMTSTDLGEARNQLHSREGGGLSDIATWEVGDPPPVLIPGLPAWATARNLDAVVWTGLGPKFGGTNGRRPTVEEVVDYLRPGAGRFRVRAEEYIRRAPRQIDTAYRRRIEAELGWTAIDG